MIYKINTIHLDPHMPLVGNYYHSTGKSFWLPVTAHNLATMLASDNPPEFRTVLSIVENNQLEMPVEGWHYLGPAYFDFDAPDIGESIDAFQRFLGKLQAAGLSLAMCRLFASGVKGFHIEIPMECFMPKIPVGGILGLPKVYRAIAEELYVDCLDLRVFSCGKGRQWRVPNRQRQSGTYKAPLTVAEALAMTAETYAELVSAPRLFPPLATPKFCPELALIYTLAQDKVTTKVTRKRQTPKVDAALKARFGSKLPPTVAALGQGHFSARGGWNQIVVQLAVVSQAVGLSADETVQAFRGLIERHESDGHRYNSPAKREAELRRMFGYVEDNADYRFSVGGIRSILPQGLRCSEFRGLEC